MSHRTPRIALIGAGVAGLVAAIDLAGRGVAVTVLERAASPGGKMREVTVEGARLDAGPTVFTLRRVFEEIFADAGATLSDHLSLRPVEILARHAWGTDERLDLFTDIDRSAEAVGALAGPAEARGYRGFCEQARRIHDTLEKPFMRAPLPTPLSLVLGAGLRGIGDLWRIKPFETLWQALGEHFHDVRLRQLFGRYATYCGSSPFLAPATLMLIAHVERDGVWLVEGGIHRLAIALADLAARLGATFRYGADAAEIVMTAGRPSGVRLSTGEHIGADAVVVNAAAEAVAAGCLGREAATALKLPPVSGRSLSAMTWGLVAPTEGFPLVRHNVFFSHDYATEFTDLFRRRRLPAEPTVYVCAQDRDAEDDRASSAVAERLLCLVNAPATGDTRPFTASEIEQCTERTFARLAACGLTVHRRPEATVTTTPEDFERLFPGTGGALYGQAVHGAMASFRRPGARSRIPGLYLAGGSTHPGAGVPMAALSGRLAAAALLADFASTSRSRLGVMPGGTSMR